MEPELAEALVDAIPVRDELVTKSDLAVFGENLMAKIDARFDRIDSRFERVEDRFERVEDRLERLEDKFDTRFDKLQARFDRLWYTLLVVLVSVIGWLVAYLT